MHNPVRIPQIVIEGSPRTRGRAYGRSASERIVRCTEFYYSLFARARQLSAPHAKEVSRESILGCLEAFEAPIKSFSPDLYEEMRGIAEGAGVPFENILMLNCRTELFRHFSKGEVQECTSAYFPRTKILGQTWDWDRALEDLVVVLVVRHVDGSELLTITEPGMVGKIGFNSHGIGVCMNILASEQPLGGVPIHVLARKSLETSSLDSAVTLIRAAPRHTSATLLLADDHGHSKLLEFDDEKVFEVCGAESIVHTNHYLSSKKPREVPILRPSSHARFACATARVRELPGQSLPDMISILTDRSHPKFPVCREFGPVAGEVVEYGTVIGVAMDLQNRTCLVSEGNPLRNEFKRIDLGEVC